MGKKDEQVFDAIQPQSWIRVRGSVQEDTFMRDLVMNAQDLMEVAHAPRKDYAPEGEKRVELHMHSNMSTMDATNKVGDLVAQGNGVIRPSQLRIMAAPKRFLMPMLQVKSRR